MDSSNPICTYHEGDGTCYRPDCPKCCVRNYRDQLDTDLPVDLPHQHAATLHAPLHTVGLLRWLSRIFG